MKKKETPVTFIQYYMFYNMKHRINDSALKCALYS